MVKNDHRLNSEIFEFCLSKWNLCSSSLDCKAFEAVQNDTKLVTISWEPCIKKSLRYFCVGVWVGEQVTESMKIMRVEIV